MWNRGQCLAVHMQASGSAENDLHLSSCFRCSDSLRAARLGIESRLG